MHTNFTTYVQILTHLELLESKLLTWGVVDGSFTRDELCTEIEKLADYHKIDEDADEILEQLIENRLLFEFNDGGRLCYRTRMAEAVRLFARLRQIRPWNTWQTAPTLVADFRFAVRPRYYPRRHISAVDAVERVQTTTPLGPITRKSLGALIRMGGNRELTLADFQVSATAQILADLQSRISRGVVVTAGTGTGKTKAFYLPVLSHIAGLITREAFWTKALALYPRNELLKDQYSETYAELLHLNDACKVDLPRRITTGVLFQDTPNTATEDSLTSWRLQGRFICPSLRCPKCTEGSLEWTISDIHARREILTCIQCGFRSTEGDLLLTRQSLSDRPPDVLFSTTEMLNRCMSDSRRAKLFGVRHTHVPRIVLLDEIHTYEGTHGAQVAYLLRRWRWAVRRNVQFTGLSATLDNAHAFFSQLTGLSPANVIHIPGDETQVLGMEYQLALRGDPVSATSLLSTTIQAAMLLRRVLDTGKPDVPTLFGKRIYVFTDNLDIVNRLYFDLRDAEGVGPTNPGVTLASYRQHAQSQPRERLRQGQSWKLSEDIGHDLSRGLVISRTSSQDTGVDRDADITVATASLEVGYNDPFVGGVIQHKAPREIAAFLQRKGRAGRRPEMHPWTVISLSDYGRDRFAYESYDQLFSPRLPERTLPISSRYVQRMQAVFALMDWLARKIPSNLPTGSIWRDLSVPATEPWTARQAWVQTYLTQLLSSPDLRNEFQSYLRGALSIDVDGAISMMWEPPRSIIMAVVPTALRRLETKWRRVPVTPGDSEIDLKGDNAPLPDFVPPNLFSDLSVPEVFISPRRRGTDVTMPIVQAMQILAPGNVTRRFAPHDNCLHWCSPTDLNRPDQDLDVKAWCSEYEILGDFQRFGDDGTVSSLQCIRPLKFTPSVTPSHIRPTSKSFLNWRSQLFVTTNGLRHYVPSNSPWSRFIDHIEFFTHAHDSHVTVRRFANGARAEIGFVRSRSADRTINIRFHADNSNLEAAVGFSQDVDGIAIRFRFPEDLRVSNTDPNQGKLRSLRAAYFRHLLRTDATLRHYANDFQLDWLSQMYLSAVSAEALENKSSIRDAHARLVEKGLGIELVRVLDVIFQTLDDDDNDNQHPQPKPEQKTRSKLEDLAHDSGVVARIAELAAVLWETPDWTSWIRGRFRATLGGALLEAFHRASSLFDSESLWLDLESGPTPHATPRNDSALEELWFTEQSPGGTGIVEHILQRFAEDPTRFFRLAYEALGPTDFELIDSEISRLIRHPQEPALSNALARVRDSVTNEELRNNILDLRRHLQCHGFVANHAVMAALHARVLRPGTTEEFDVELSNILDQWRTEEERLGIEIDLRVIAYVFGRHRELGRALPFLPEMNLEDPQWRYQAYASILWPRGNVVRSHNLSSWNPFCPLPLPDRLLVLDCLEVDRTVVDIRDSNWRDRIRDLLADKMEATMCGPISKPVAMKEAILSLATEPTEIGFLHVFPRVDGTSRRGDLLEVRLACREAAR